MKVPALHRVVQFTARTSALLFTAAEISQAVRPLARARKPLYLAFVAAHAVHLTAVARFAVRTRGRALFPGGRDLRDVGGWPTMLGIYALFFLLALAGWAADSGHRGGRPGVRRAGRAATGVIGAMFVSVYLGQLPRSRWYAVPASVIAGAVIASTAVHRTQG